ncbi:MAG: hypothetical protein AAF514_02870 [Verrucomicrobiota bacterium]
MAELANDWIGYLPDREAHKLGGYQCGPASMVSPIRGQAKPWWTRSSTCWWS